MDETAIREINMVLDDIVEEAMSASIDSHFGDDRAYETRMTNIASDRAHLFLLINEVADEVGSRYMALLREVSNED